MCLYIFEESIRIDIALQVTINLNQYRRTIKV